MRVGRSGPHLGCDPNGLHEFLRGRAGALGRLRMSLDAIGTLGDMGDGNGNQLLRLGVQGAGG